jgi:hypothetical protein
LQIEESINANEGGKNEEKIEKIASSNKKVEK